MGRFEKGGQVQAVGHIRFGAFELDIGTGELRRKRRTVRLSPKPLQVLALLARSPGQLVTREEIRNALWGSDTFVDFEHALNFSIREVRAALGDSAKKPRYIETLPRRGYRFIAEITQGAEVRVKAAGGSDDTTQLEAYGYYARARKSFTQAGKEALEQARNDFERALALNPGYAMAH
jgi:DNA-binding winged helix-turn-helix (wHTH) protein